MKEVFQKTDKDHISLADVEHEIIHHTELPRTTISNIIDTIIDRIGALSSWLWIITVGVILYSVIARYVFSSGSVMLEEVQWHLAGAAWLIGLSYTLVHDDHVRVDVLHERFSTRTQAWIELLGILLLLLPFLFIALWELVPYAMASFQQGERSPAPAGLEMRWILKFIMPISMLLLIFASFSRMFKATALLFGAPRPLQQSQNSVAEKK